MADFGLALEEGVKPASEIVPGNSVDVAAGGYPEGEPGDECETHVGADTDTEP